MAKVLCITSQLTGILYSGLTLARRLSKAGHDITYASYPEMRQTILDHDVDFLPLAPNRFQAFLQEDGERSLWRRVREIRARRRQAVAASGVSGLTRVIKDLGPDLALIDIEMHEQVIAAAASGPPIALLNSFASIWRRPGLPPTHHFVRPGVGWKGTRTGMDLLWRNLRLRKWRRAWIQRLRHVGCDRLSILRCLAADHGFDLSVRADFGQWLIPFTFSGYPVLSLHALEFEFPHRPADGVHYVGPLVEEERPEHGVGDEGRARLETLFERRGRGGARRLIYAGFGASFTSDLEVVKRLIEAVGRRQDWDLVLSLGRSQSSAALGAVPGNVHAFAWVPQPTVLRHADVAVCHGGMNTIDECVLFAVPMLVYCGRETDMAGNTARVVHHGMGIAGSRRDDVDAILRHLDQAMTDLRYRQSVGRMRQAYLAYSQNRVAERVVESLIEEAAGRHPPTFDGEPSLPGTDG